MVSAIVQAPPSTLNSVKKMSVPSRSPFSEASKLNLTPSVFDEISISGEVHIALPSKSLPSKISFLTRNQSEFAVKRD